MLSPAYPFTSNQPWVPCTAARGEPEFARTAWRAMHQRQPLLVNCIRLPLIPLYKPLTHIGADDGLKLLYCGTFNRAVAGKVISSVLCSLHSTLCSLLSAPCSLQSALCSLPCVQCCCSARIDNTPQQTTSLSRLFHFVRLECAAKCIAGQPLEIPKHSHCERNKSGEESRETASEPPKHF
jgi:hypothetical protein